MLRKSRVLILCSVLVIISLACTAPALSATPTISAPPVVLAPAATIEVSPTPIPSLPVELTSTATEVPATEVVPTAVETSLPPSPISFPSVSFGRDTNCRLGPARNYFTQTSFLENRIAVAEGRNRDASWLWVQSLTAKTYCWVSVVNLKNPESYLYLPVIALPPLPEPPSQLYVHTKDCVGRNRIVLHWPNVSGETGFHVYRNGIMLGSLKTDAVEFVDYPPDGKEYIYEVESINSFGLSVRVAVTTAGCSQ